MKKLLLTLLMVSLFLIVGCNSSATDSTGSNIPSGNDCAENIAYLQSGVDKYKETQGEYPSDVQQLLISKFFLS